ncbi:MAG: carboxymuconolactone decarboxylase [Chloroflexi bacterium HGW-Chloroflexi-8]|nr:MAG: carboxymuconolactone decarboxylase [Chloroflexi bacterium HGW-Chloroflexi-8]
MNDGNLEVKMWYVPPVADKDAEGVLLELYNQDLEKDGYIWNTTRVWSYRPELAAPWRQVLKIIRSNMRLRAYELVTIAASRAIGCVYCMLAHGEVLHKNGFSVQQIIAILEDFHTADLSPLEVHMMDYAFKISTDTSLITQADIDLLHQDGLNNQQISDIAMAAVARNFMSRMFEAFGVNPDPELQVREPELWDYLKKSRFS